MRMIWKSSARDLVADPTREGWAALTLCILLDVGHDLAFDLLTDHETPRKPKKLTAQDWQDIEALQRQGVKIAEIGRLYGRTRSAMSHAIHRKKKRRSRK